MRDFDLERDEHRHGQAVREFKYAGEMFTGTLNLPGDVVARYLGSLRSIDNEFAAAADSLFAAFLGPDEFERFQKVRPQMVIREMTAIAAWIVEEETGRPTPASSASGPGRETSADTSTDGSRSPDRTPTGSLSAVS